jgi:CheY-like chemotaxis protein
MADIYLLVEGKEEGPYAEDEIQQALAWGFIPSDIPAWKEGMADWVQVGKLIGLPKESKPWIEIHLSSKEPAGVDSGGQVLDQPTPRPAGAEKRKGQILIIDDGVAFTTIVKLMLELKGDYEVSVENNPLSAIATAKSLKPDIVLLDVIMPEMDGCEVHKQFKADPSLKHIPIIFLTATVRQKDVEEHKGMIGGSYYVAKPVSADGLVKAIEERILS